LKTVGDVFPLLIKADAACAADGTWPITSDHPWAGPVSERAPPPLKPTARAPEHHRRRMSQRLPLRGHLR